VGPSVPFTLVYVPVTEPPELFPPATLSTPDTLLDVVPTASFCSIYNVDELYTFVAGFKSTL
jgi:hypothetical protein